MGMQAINDPARLELKEIHSRSQKARKLMLEHMARSRVALPRNGLLKRVCAVCLLVAVLAACTGVNRTETSTERSKKIVIKKRFDAELASRNRMEKLQRQMQASNMLVKPSAPRCDYTVNLTDQSKLGWPAKSADPELIRIAGLELERDCYKKAERIIRGRLERIQTLTSEYWKN